MPTPSVGEYNTNYAKKKIFAAFIPRTLRNLDIVIDEDTPPDKRLYNSKAASQAYIKLHEQALNFPDFSKQLGRKEKKKKSVSLLNINDVELKNVFLDPINAKKGRDKPISNVSIHSKAHDEFFIKSINKAQQYIRSDRKRIEELDKDVKKSLDLIDKFIYKNNNANQ